MRLNHQLGICAFCFLLVACGEDVRVAGNGTYIGNGQVTGRILLPSGAPAVGTLVECVPLEAEPGHRSVPEWGAVVDSLGRYTCSELPDGQVGIFAIDTVSRMQNWHLDSAKSPESAPPRIDTLSRPGGLRIALPSSTQGILLFTGLNRIQNLSDSQQPLVVELPSGWIGSIKLQDGNGGSVVLGQPVSIASGVTDSVDFLRKSMKLRIPLGGGLASTLADFPLLVRLDSTWNGYASSLADGTDLRLSATSGVPLPSTLASWNPQGRTAAIWTILDTLEAPGDSIEVILSWGLPVPPKVPGAFTADHGWLAAWPMDDASNPFGDRLGRFNGTATAISMVSGPIGGAGLFNGTNSVLRIAHSSSSAIVPDQGVFYTLSCWARLDRFQSTIGQVAGFGEFGGRIYFKPAQTIVSGQTDTNVWVAKDHLTTPKMGARYHASKASTKEWTHLAVTVDGDSARFYVNGVRQTRISNFDNYSVPRIPADFAIGAAIDTSGSVKWSFPGAIAEVWMQGKVRSEDWLRLVSANQHPGAPRARQVE
jgi:hypothetical protein